MRASLAILLALASLTAAAPARAGTFGFGRPATPQEIAGWDIDISSDGAGLPPGHGSVAEGAKVFAEKCAMCHGDHGQGKPMDPLVGGQGSLQSKKPLKTVGSYWPYATTLFDFVHRAMPFNAPQSLSPEEVYAVSAYILNLNHIVPDDAVMDAKTLPAVNMPAHDAYVSQYRPGK